MVFIQVPGTLLSSGDSFFFSRHCTVCGVRYKTRPGLSYHYAHSHIAGSGGSSSSGDHHNNSSSQASSQPPVAPPQHEDSGSGSGPSSEAVRGSQSQGGGQGDSPLAGLRKFQDSFLSFLKTPGSGKNFLEQPSLVMLGIKRFFSFGSVASDLRTGNQILCAWYHTVAPECAVEQAESVQKPRY